MRQKILKLLWRYLSSPLHQAMASGLGLQETFVSELVIEHLGLILN
jgi:hypothetical protein